MKFIYYLLFIISKQHKQPEPIKDKTDQWSFDIVRLCILAQ